MLPCESPIQLEFCQEPKRSFQYYSEAVSSYDSVDQTSSPTKKQKTDNLAVGHDQQNNNSYHLTSGLFGNAALALSHSYHEEGPTSSDWLYHGETWPLLQQPATENLNENYLVPYNDVFDAVPSNQYYDEQVTQTNCLPQQDDYDSDNANYICMPKISNIELSRESSTSAFSQSYDTCFGMVNSNTPIRLEDATLESDSTGQYKIVMNGGMLAVHHLITAKYLCLLETKTAQAIWNLVQTYSVTLQALATKNFSDTSESVEKSISKRSKSNPQYRVSMVVYGFSEEGDAIAKLLDESGVYLQHPQERDETVPYDNPQYLCATGTRIEIPDYLEPDHLALLSKNAVAVQSIKSRGLEVMDTANGPTFYSSVGVNPMIKTELMSHQEKALAMMVEKEKGVIFNNEFGSLWREEVLTDTAAVYRNTVTGQAVYKVTQLCRGGLLADDMGLGKTLVVLALIAGSLEDRDNAEVQSNVYAKSSRTTLVITPLSTIINWENQILQHLKPGSLRVFVYHGLGTKRDINFSDYDIIITTFATITSRFQKNSQDTLPGEKSLFTYNWFRIVLDEAHMIKDRTTKQHKTMCSLKAQHRWCLTGTPIQNQVNDFGSLLSFLRIYPFDNQDFFSRHITRPMERGDEVGMRNLRSLIHATTLRRTKETLGIGIDSKGRTDLTVKLQFTLEERELYEFFKRNTYESVEEMFESYGVLNAVGSIFKAILRLRQISNHGLKLLPPGAIQAFRAHKEEKVVRLRDDESCESCGLEISFDKMSKEENVFGSCGHFICTACVGSARKIEGATETACPVCTEQSRTASADSGDIRIPEPYIPSSKVQALLQNLKEFRQEPNGSSIKSVVFTCWVKMIDLMEQALISENIGFARIDGGHSHNKRKAALQQFNKDENCTVLLASIGSAGTGLNLTAACRVHIMEPQWNPMSEEQALDRVYRIGQTREVKTYRYIIAGSIDEYIISIQKYKLDIIQTSFAENTEDKALENRLMKLKKFLEE